jgi:hypothetical protein
MLNNRRRVTNAEIRRARRWAAFSALFTFGPVHIAVSAFAVFALFLIASTELAPHPWLGACYEAQVEVHGIKHPSRIPVCVKHIPFAGGFSATHSS